MNSPKDILLKGSQLLEPYLVPRGFQFRFGDAGRSHGGDFAWAEFVRDDRSLEFHFRWSLGLVRFNAGEHSAFHETYMRELGVWDQCMYPGFSDNPLIAFDELAHDLGLADDFVEGTAIILRRAAAKEKADQLNRSEDLMAGYVGDKDSVELLRKYFHERRFAEVVEIARNLKYPSRMSQAEITMVELARKRIDS